MSEFIVSVPDEAAEYFIARFGLDGTKMMGYDLTGEIVRCKDCEHLNIVGKCPCGFFAMENLDGYCAWGARRERETVEVWNQWSADDVTCSEEPCQNRNG